MKKNSKQKGRRQGRARVGPVGQYAEDAWSLAQRTARGLNEIRKLVNTEFKYVDNTTAAQAASQAGVFNSLTGIAQGATVNQREGNSIKTEDLDLAYTVYISGSATKSSVRIVLFRDHENVGSAPAGSDLLEVSGTAVAPLSAFAAANSQMGPDEVGRFTVIYDMVHVLSINGDETAHGGVRMKLGQHVRYSGTAGGNTREGALYMAIFTNEPTNVPTVDWYCRVRYVDN